MSQQGFPWILVRGHGQVYSPHPPSPWPRGAAQPQNRGRSRLPNAAVFCLKSRAAGRTQGNETEKFMRKFWHLKSQSFGNCRHANFSLDLRHCMFEMSWSHRVGWKTWRLWFSHVGSQNDLELFWNIIDLKHTTTLAQLMESTAYNGTLQNSKIQPSACFVSLLLVFHVRGQTWPNEQMKSIWFDLRVRPSEMQMSHSSGHPQDWRNNSLIVMAVSIYRQAETFDRKESSSKILFLNSSKSRCRKQTSRNHKKLQHTCKQYPPNTWTINISSTSSQRSHVSSGFPLNPPPRPWPSLFLASTAALVSRSRSTTESWPHAAAKCSGVLPQEPRPGGKPPAEPKGTKGKNYHPSTLGVELHPPWNHFWNIDFLYPGIISEITDPHHEIISAGVLGPENHLTKKDFVCHELLPENSARKLKSCQKNEMITGGLVLLSCY